MTATCVTINSISFSIGVKICFIWKSVLSGEIPPLFMSGLVGRVVDTPTLLVDAANTVELDNTISRHNVKNNLKLFLFNLISSLAFKLLFIDNYIITIDNYKSKQTY